MDDNWFIFIVNIDTLQNVNLPKNPIIFGLWEKVSKQDFHFFFGLYLNSIVSRIKRCKNTFGCEITFRLSVKGNLWLCWSCFIAPCKWSRKLAPNSTNQSDTKPTQIVQITN